MPAARMRDPRDHTTVLAFIVPTLPWYSWLVYQSKEYCVLALRLRAQAAVAQLSPPIRRILMHSLILGLAMSVADLLFNFYLVSLGYATDTAGFLSTVYRFAGVVTGIPIGMLIDRAGAQRALQVGAVLFAFGWAAQLMVAELWMLVITQAIIGASGLLALTSVVPLLTNITHGEQRAAIFGINAGAAMVIGLVGATVGGLLPALFGGLMNVGPQSTTAYRLALGSVVILGLLALLPVLKTISLLPDAPARTNANTVVHTADRLPFSFVIRMTLPALLLGIGAGVFLPFQNLFFRQVFQLSDAVVGTILAGGALTMGLGAIFGSPFAKRFGLKRAAAFLRLGAAPSLLMMLLPSLELVVIGFFIRGACIGASFPLNDAYTMQLVSPRNRGKIVSATSMLWSLGWATTSSVAGIIEKQYGFTPLLIVGTIAYVLSALAIFALPEE
jgi:MFS family permease